MVGRGRRYGSMRVIGMVLLSERYCVPLRPRWPPVPPTSRALPPLCALPVCPPVLPFFFCFCARAPCCSRAPCMCPLLFFVLPGSCCPAPPLLPVSPPILLLAVDPACTSALPVRAALSLACATRVPYPCPSPSPLPFPLGAPSVPASHPILAAWRPVWGGGGVYLWSGLWPCTPHALHHSRELRCGMLVIVLQLHQ